MRIFCFSDPPERPTVNISTQSSVSTGDSVNLTCDSDALPSPTYSWEIPPHAQVEFSQENRSITIKEASSYHTGTYTCNVKNKHGHSSTPWDLEVKSTNNAKLMRALLGVGVFALVASVILMIYYFLQNKGKKVFF
ncbi:hypothetical protein AB205_0113240 [Aquarana catesbeiana]|uniref:Ig-like domain-containing protein n=1 Tax=Aquarana catesbeiana TaxID=8400 RepID=A0A2G9S6W7_AQUCT|nr:hypothetical protein AB205_0113240 [Aquarana catesbeiana]